MAKKKRRSRSNSSGDFFKLLMVLLLLGGLLWIWQKKNTSPQKIAPAKLPHLTSNLEEKIQAPSSPESQALPSAKNLTGVFPKEAWLDDYLQVSAPLAASSGKDLLVAIGLAPVGKNPDQVQNPDQLRPSLLVVKKEADQFLRKDQFNFETTLPTEAGIQGSDLRGIPRITLKSLVDLNGDGQKEIVTSVDTHGDYAQAIAFLKWEENRLQWIKTRNRAGHEKLALWLVGSTAVESQEITTQKAEGKDLVEVIQKKAEMDPNHPEKGFVWKTTYWQMKDGVLQER